MKIAVIGMGTMGGPMARNLLKAGHAVVVHNRTRARDAPLGTLKEKVKKRWPPRAPPGPIVRPPLRAGSTWS